MFLQRFGNTALMCACRDGHTSVVEALLKVPGIDIHHANHADEVRI